MSSINMGVVGTGIFAKHLHYPAIQSLESNPIKITAAFNRTRAKAEEYAKFASIPSEKVYDTLDEILADESVDAIDALLPVQYNLSTIEAAVKAGKPICIEKPIAGNLEDAKAIVKLSQETDVPVMILENWFYYQGNQKVLEHLPSIGKVFNFTHTCIDTFAPTSKYQTTSWRMKPHHIGGYLSDGGVHQMAALTSILGPVKSVNASTTQVREESGDVDTLTALMRLESGAFGSYTYTTVIGACKKVNKIEIYGEEGSIVYDLSDKEGAIIDVYCAKKEKQTFTVKENFYGISGEFANFYEAVSAKDKSFIKCKVEDAYSHLAIIWACLTSAEQGSKSVDVPGYN
ncbi:NAD(P)-binding protein [Nadsonia fulvescens var. elongata DSM 6958]|uniref:NAD(P)-binding protein n=1 Tax=Nadsonia fulvescens var. elongata DSM 6958 TaxID=857566 RepID=A0A1E3PQC6_9ASCO|nr:NAD(P)-binding protein [Nadsonia fulvescens var. elongata DSM 6958]